VFRIRDAGVNRYPLNPRLQIWFLFLRVAGENLTTVTQAGEVRQAANGDETVH
jgi:hypothetical protein